MDCRCSSVNRGFWPPDGEKNYGANCTNGDGLAREETRDRGALIVRVWGAERKGSYGDSETGFFVGCVALQCCLGECDGRVAARRPLSAAGPRVSPSYTLHFKVAPSDPYLFIAPERLLAGILLPKQ
jgi:hypothetical protein